MLSKVATMTLTSPPEGRWFVELKKEGGGAPPELGVSDVADLAGRKLEVRDAGGVTPFLVGTIPTMAATGGGGGLKGPTQFGKVDLQRPAVNPPDPDAKGEVEMKKSNKGQEFEVEGEKLPVGPAITFSVFVETAVGAGTFNKVGDMSLVSATKGSYKLELESKSGAPAALGVANLSDLTGRLVEVRD